MPRGGVQVLGVAAFKCVERSWEALFMIGIGAMVGKFDWVLKFLDGLGDEHLLAFCGGDAGNH